MLKKLLLIVAFLLPFSTVTVSRAQAPIRANVVIAEPTQQSYFESQAVDPRALVLRDYLNKYNSPLADNAEDFVQAADLYGVDWKLVPAIAGVESTFGKFTPGGYNGWGWGVYGNQAIYFSSWTDAIYTINKALKENYINRGLTTPYEINTVYASSPTWGSRVNYFENDIDSFAKADIVNYEVSASSAITLNQVVSPLPKPTLSPTSSLSDTLKIPNNPQNSTQNLALKP